MGKEETENTAGGFEPTIRARKTRDREDGRRNKTTGVNRRFVDTDDKRRPGTREEYPGQFNK